MMSGIRGTNTGLEMQLRSALHARGLRYRLHGARLPGRPDLVLARYRAVVFVHGCFWHGHDCHLMVWPKTRAEFWRSKIEGNVARDMRRRIELAGLGWRVFEVWECAVRGPDAMTFDAAACRIHEWLESSEPRGELRGPQS